MRKTIATTLALICTLAAGLTSAADLQAIQDRLDIEQVWSRYALALDTADPEAYSSLFTPDAYLEVDGTPFKGHQAIEKLIRDIRQKLNIDSQPADSRGRRFGPIRHIASDLVVNLQGDHATSESYWTEIMTSGKNPQGVGNPPSVLKMGRYEDELIRKNGKWLFSRRIITGDLQMPKPDLPPPAPAASHLPSQPVPARK
jgi:ketosteroid isomerase-like protein